MTSATNEREPCPDSHCGDVSAMTCAAYNDTSVQPQTHAMGAARSERGGGETAYDRTDRYGSEMFPVPGVRAVNMAWQKLS